MLIRFWCDSEITFLRGLHKNMLTVPYFSIINVLCGAGGDTSFAPQSNLVKLSFKSYLLFFRHTNIPKNSVHFTGRQLTNVLHRTSLSGTGEEEHAAVLSTYDSLCHQIRAMKDLPLAISTIQGISPVFRYSEVSHFYIVLNIYGSYSCTTDNLICHQAFKNY